MSEENKLPAESEDAAVPMWCLITVTYNSADALRAFWGGVTLPDNVEWIVVDNASSDESASVAEALGARVIRLATNRGFGGANNVGFDATRAPYVGFINPDVRVDTETLPIVEQIIQQTNGLVSPQLINPDGTPQANGRGWPFLLEKVRNRLESNDAESGYRRFAPEGEDIAVTWFMGAAVLGSRAVLETLGPWDERFFVYYEDSDLGLRAGARGIRRTVTGRARWVHGWARETTKFEWSPWRRELPSMAKFYSRYPSLLSPWPRATKRRLERKYGAI